MVISVSGYSVTGTNLSKFSFAVAVRVDLLVSKRTAFSFNTNWIPSFTLLLQLLDSLINLSCLFVHFITITPPATPPTTPKEQRPFP
jgi:hypothetical protein